jgi:hypothetical protein
MRGAVALLAAALVAPAEAAWLAGAARSARARGGVSTLSRSTIALQASSTQTRPLLDAISDAGVVGVLASDEQQLAVEAAAAALEGMGAEPAQARVPLGGTYDLLYSMAKGGSNGKVGPFIGKVRTLERAARTGALGLATRA